MDKRTDLALALAVLGIGLGYYYMASELTNPPGSLDPLGPGTVPRALAAFIAFTGLATLVRRLWLWQREPGWLVEEEGEGDEPGYPASLLRVIVVAALTGLYLLVLGRLGYLVTTPTYVVALLLTLGVRHWRPLVGLGLGTTVIIYLLFAVLGVRLPLGILRGIV